MDISWENVFGIQTSLLELVLRGSIMYLALFLILRFLVKRQVGGMGITDVLMVVLIADAAQNGMAGEYRTIPEGLVLCATIIFWNHALDWIEFRFPSLRTCLEPQPLELIRNGRILQRNLQQELITKEELLSQLREQGVEHVNEVKRAYVEGDGKISVIRQDAKQAQGKHSQQTIPGAK